MKKIVCGLMTCLAFVGCNKSDDTVNSKPDVVKNETNNVAPEAKSAAILDTIKEIEPNNRFSEATPLKIDQVGQGFIQAEGEQKTDADWWKFELDSRKAVTITLSGLEALDLMFSVHNNQEPGEAIVKAYSNSDTDSEKLAKLGEVYPNLNLDAGTYYVKVYQYKKKAKDKDIFDATNPYNLKITTADIDPIMENEPNERQVDANPLPVGEERFGYFQVKSDVDWYKIELPQDLAGQNALKITLKAPTKIKPSLIIRNDIGAVLKEIGAMKDGGETLVIPAYLIKDPRAPIYLELNGRWAHNTSEKYSIKAEVIALDVAWEDESNDRAVEATKITESMFIRGNIDQGKILDQKPWRAPDEDWYQLDLENEKMVTVTLSGLSGVDLILSMYNEDGSERLISVNDNEKKEGEIITPVLVKKCLFKVNAKNNTQFNAEDPYELQIKPYETAGQIEREPNNKAENATPLAIGPKGALEGWLHPKDDADWYKIDNTKGPAGLYLIKVTGIPLVPVKVTVYDEVGVEYAAQEKTLDKEPVLLEVPMDEKTYTVKVEHGGKKSLSNPRDNYLITVTAVNGAK